MDTEPVPLSEDVDEELQASYAQCIRERVRVPEMIVQAYRTAWASFYDWEPGYTIDDLLELQDSESSMEVDSNPSLTFTLWPGDIDRSPQSFELFEVTLPHVSVVHFAYPKYESCTPATRNISHERDQRILDFIPYADEPGFYPTLYAQQHSSFTWQISWYDVDYKLIALHAAWSLHDSGLSPRAIDEYKVRFLPIITGGSGLLDTLCHRDLINWGTVAPSHQLAVLRDASHKAMHQPGRGVWRSISTLDSLFCRSTNCVEGLCMLHKAPKPSLRHTKHKKRNEEYMESTRPCGPKCYRAEQTPEDDEVMEINQDICDLLKIFPDTPICKLATLCKADCRDVYYHRIMFLPKRSSSIPQQVEVHGKVPKPGIIDYQTDICDHDGPCVQPACICAVRQRWCSKRCGCAARCGARKGCTCEDGKCLHSADIKGSYDNLCPCIDAGWECSPELCTGVRNKRLKKTMKHACKYMYLQKDKKPTIVVKEATYGLGAFANGKITAGTFLGEYIAEKYPLAPNERIDRAQRKVNRHRKLNYLFSLNDDSGVLDAATVGDPTRCLNDSQDQSKLNVKAEPTTVDGDMRIYFWAFKDVKKDEELLLGYGQGYWANYDVPSSDEERFDAEVNGNEEDEHEEFGGGTYGITQDLARTSLR